MDSLHGCADPMTDAIFQRIKPGNSVDCLLKISATVINKDKRNNLLMPERRRTPKQCCFQIWIIVLEPRRARNDGTASAKRETVPNVFKTNVKIRSRSGGYYRSGIHQIWRDFNRRHQRRTRRAKRIKRNGLVRCERR